jgi:predicted naringenin-chalcone synthase
MTFRLAGIGTALPEHAIRQQDAAEAAKTFCVVGADQERLMSVLYRRTGVRSRHSVLLNSSTDGVLDRQEFYSPARDAGDRGPTTATRMQRFETDATELACRASRSALGKAGVAAREITHLVSVSCSGFSAPGYDLQLIQRIELSAGIARTHVGFMGCHGAMNALRVARAFTESSPRARVLICAVELCTLHQRYGWDPEQVVANALFADGAAAVVGRADDPAGGEWCLVDQASAVIPGTADYMSWRIGDHGFKMTLSARVPEVIRARLRPWLERWLEGHRLTLGDVGSWAVHPGGPRIVQACQDALTIDPSQLAASREVLAEFGNMSSPTVLFILDRLQTRRANRPCVALAFGPGLTIEAALLK